MSRLPNLPPNELRLIDALWTVYHAHTNGHDCDSVEVDELGPTGDPRIAFVGPECFIAQSLLRFVSDLDYVLRMRR